MMSLLARTVCGLAALGFLSVPASAGFEAFHDGPVVTVGGRIATVKEAAPIPAGTKFKVVFDVDDDAKPGKLNRGIDSAGRFINMHVAAGVPRENIKVAVVIHGTATLDALNREVYRERKGVDSRNASLIAALASENVDIILCGQSAAFHDVTSQDIVSGVTLALSAMTAHAQLQQAGYTLNPF